MIEPVREEQLREAASMGNVRAVTHLLSMGVDVNACNNVNGWNSLHWAAKRGHVDVVRILLMYGARKDIQTKKGETCADLTKNQEIRRMLGLEESVGDEDLESKNTFVPNYIQNPDHMKLWSLPDEVESPAIKPMDSQNSSKPVVAQPHSHQANFAAVAQPLAQPTVAQSPLTRTQMTESQSENQEVLVYSLNQSQSIGEASLLGAIFLPPSSTLATALERAMDELDAPKGRILRNTGALQIPVTEKQLPIQTVREALPSKTSLVIIS
jgi:ankyrin repeat protein